MATFIDQDQKMCEKLRYAILMANEATGLVETLVFFEDGWTTIHQYFPATNASLTETLQAATQRVIERYQIPRSNIQVKLIAQPATDLSSQSVQHAYEMVRQAS